MFLVVDISIFPVLCIEFSDLSGEMGVDFFLKIEVLLKMRADADKMHQPTRNRLVDETHFLVLFSVVVQFLSTTEDEF